MMLKGFSRRQLFNTLGKKAGALAAIAFTFWATPAIASPQSRSEDGTHAMAIRSRHVSSVDDLIAAANDKEVREIIVSTDLHAVSPINLLPGQTLRSDSGEFPTLEFRENAD